MSKIPYRCPDCLENFESWGECLAHLKKVNHAGVLISMKGVQQRCRKSQAFNCRLCRVSVFSQTSFDMHLRGKRHQLLETQERTDKSFNGKRPRRMSDESDQLIVKKGKKNKRWHCPVCETNFLVKKDKKKHMKTAHGGAQGGPLNFVEGSDTPNSTGQRQDEAQIDSESLEDDAFEGADALDTVDQEDASLCSSLAPVQSFFTPVWASNHVEDIQQKLSDANEACLQLSTIPNRIDGAPPHSLPFEGFLESVGLDFLGGVIARCPSSSETTAETVKEIYAEFLTLRFIRLIAGQTDQNSGLQNTMGLHKMLSLYSKRYKEELQCPDNIKLTVFLQELFDLVLPVFSPILFKSRGEQVITISDQAAAYVNKMPEPTDFYTFFASKTSASNTLPKIEEADAELADLTDKSTSRAWEAGTNWNASVYDFRLHRKSTVR